MIGKTISHYKILEKLGEGGMGVVYKAEDTKLKRSVALKFLPADLTRDQEAKERFIREAQAASALQHHNICTIHDIDETSDGQLFMVMDYYDGETLEKKLQDNPLGLDHLFNYAIQISIGLSKAHEKGIVHRDIKPSNIIITEDNTVKILDFGLAKLSSQIQLTKESSTLGTSAYMSPEQIQGETIDQRADVWSLGVLLYQMVTGQLPFKGDYQSAVFYSVLNEDHASITGLRSGIPLELERILNKCLAKDPGERYQHMDDLQVDLNTSQDSLDSDKNEDGVPVGKIKSGLSKKRKQFILYGMIAAAIIFMIILFYFFSPFLSEDIDRKSIAVLPFKNLSEDPENEYFSDGITEDIITQLSKIGDMRVISRTSIMLYKNSNKNLREIGRELGVATILEGSVRKADNRIRIVGQLIDVEADEHLWAETYDRELKDIFEVQSDVAQKIAAALRAKLSASEIKRIEDKPTDNLSAYSYYLKGREYYYRYARGDNEQAIRLFKNAIELDPNYTLAYAGLGDCYAQKAGRFVATTSWFDSAIAVSNHAISLDPECAEAYKALGLVYLFRGWLQQSLIANKKALELNPNYHPALGNYAWLYYHLGDLENAYFWANKALLLDPSGPISHIEIGVVHRTLGNYRKAERFFKQAMNLQENFIWAYRDLIALNIVRGNDEAAIQYSQKVLSIAPDEPGPLMWAGNAELFAGNYEIAREHYEKIFQNISRTDTRFIFKYALVPLGFIYWRNNQKDKANLIFNQYLQSAKLELEEGSEVPRISLGIAGIHSIMNDKEKAYKWLRSAIDNGWRDYRSARRDPTFKNLHNDIEFKQLMETLEDMVAQMRKNAEEISNI
jgi:serine/threonine protein kinase/Flp pilus assembly protein TadD